MGSSAINGASIRANGPYAFIRLKTAIYVDEEPLVESGTRKSGKLPNDSWDIV